MTFLWGSLLVLLLAVPLLLVVYWWSRRRRRPVAARYSSLSLIRAAGPSPTALAPPRPGRPAWPRRSAALAFAVARPIVVLSRAQQPVHDRPRDGRVGEHVLHGHRADAARGGPGAPRSRSSRASRRAPRSASSRSAASPRCIEAPDRPTARWSPTRSASLTTGRRTAIGQRDPVLDRRHRRDRPQRCPRP